MAKRPFQGDDSRIHFAKRLRELCTEANSISGVARDLGINRQQFARYLNGTTFPRTAVLTQLAEYFGTPVSDLFAHGDDLPGSRHRLRSLPAISELLSTCGLVDATEADIEAGFYLIYRRSFRFDDRVFVSLMTIRPDAAGVMRFKARTPSRIARVTRGLYPSVTFEGVFVRSGDNLVALTRASHTASLITFSFMPPLAIDHRLRAGLHMSMGAIGQRRPMAARVFIEKLEDNPSRILAAARKQGLYEDHQLSAQARFLLDDPPGNTSQVMSVND